MDEYYAKLSREVLNGAYERIVTAQDYMLRGNAPEPYQRQVRHILNQIVSLQERILLNTTINSSEEN